MAIAVSGLLLVLPGCGQVYLDPTPDARTRYGYETEFSTRQELNTETRLRFIVAELRHGRYTLAGGWNRASASCVDWRWVLDFSEASSDTPHSMKIYQPWVKDWKSFSLADQEDQPVGQIIVKESWAPKELPADAIATGSFIAEHDGKYYTPDKPADLFIMFKVDSTTPGTDEGWIYGVVTPDGKDVVSSGRIAVCVDCHQNARHDRVFGEKPNPIAIHPR